MPGRTPDRARPLAPAPGRMNVDFEERVDFARLRQYRLGQAMRAMEQAGLGALLVFRLRWPVLRTLGVCGVAGLLLTLAT